jgi:hypothetical protein
MRFARSAFCSALLLLAFSGAAISLRVDNHGELAADRAVPDPPKTLRILRKNPTPPEQRIANGDWADRLRSEDFWQQMRSPQSRPEPGARRAPSSARPETPRGAWGFRNEEGRSRTFSSRDGGGYRTVCVRLCDGYFWPVSFAAPRASLAQDRRKCEQSCDAPTRLYVSKDTEAPLEDMRDENGRYYRDLKTAFVYRTSYLESCKCRAHPWEAEAQARHAGYAQDFKSSLRQR